MRFQWIPLRATITFGISLLFVLLFVYASMSKLMDMEKFQVQLGQSPIFSAFAATVAWFVIAIELITSGLLLFQRTRRSGFYLSFALMVMFTTYIVIILNFSSFIPCSCGGVLEKMGWTEHLIFNGIFILLAIIAIVLSRNPQNSPGIKVAKFKFTLLPLTGVFVASISIVVALYIISEGEIHRNNGFIRRYIPHPVTTIKGLDIKYNSYYLAGVAGSRIYLGNTSAPAHILSVDTTLTNVKEHKLKLDNVQNITFYSPQIRIVNPHFFLVDGNVPVIFKGQLSDWKAELLWRGNLNNSFARMEVVSLSQFVFSGLDRVSNQNILGRIDLKSPDTFKVSTHLLNEQIDGIFDSDGMLKYNSKLNRLVYIYYYRNEFVTADMDLNMEYHGRTIDTVKTAVIKIASTNSGQVRTLEGQPLMVNIQSATSGDYLFIKSKRLGRYESEEMLKDASIIDVYDLKTQSYEFSFYLYDYERENIKSFGIHKNILIGLTDHHIVLYRLHKQNFNLEPIQH